MRGTMQGKSIHCGFDPTMDPPDKHEVPLPDLDQPVEFEPASPHTLGSGAKVKAAESNAPPVGISTDKPIEVKLSDCHVPTMQQEQSLAASGSLAPQKPSPFEVISLSIHCRSCP